MPSSTDDIEYVVEPSSTASAHRLNTKPPTTPDVTPISPSLADLPNYYASLAKSRLTGEAQENSVSARIWLQFDGFPSNIILLMFNYLQLKLNTLLLMQPFI